MCTIPSRPSSHHSYLPLRCHLSTQEAFPRLIKWARSAVEHYFYQKAIFRRCPQVSGSQSLRQWSHDKEFPTAINLCRFTVECPGAAGAFHSHCIELGHVFITIPQKPFLVSDFLETQWINDTNYCYVPFSDLRFGGDN